MISRVLATLLLVLFLFNSVDASYAVEQLTKYFCIAFCTYPRLLGRRRKGSPQHNRASWFEVGDGYTLEETRRCSLGGSGTAAAMALQAACSGLQIQELKQNKTYPRWWSLLDF